MNRNRRYIFLLSILLLLTAAVGGTLAFLSVETLSVQNQFESAYVTCEVVVGEIDTTNVFQPVNSGNGDVIKIKNTGNVDAYIRTAIVVNWMDSAGNVLGTAPVETTSEKNGDYAFTVNTVKWNQDTSTGFYYYIDRVAAGDTTQVLLNNITVNKPKGYDNYELSVEVIAEAIQADGTTDDTEIPAYQDAWGISIPGNSGN